MKHTQTYPSELRALVAGGAGFVGSHLTNNHTAMKAPIVILIATLALLTTLKAHAAPHHEWTVAKDTIVTPAPDNTADQDSTIIELSKALDEVVIKGVPTVQSGDTTKTFFTKELRRGTSTSAQLLGKLPNFYYDWSQNTLTYNNSSNIVVLVDGIEKALGNVLNMQHLRFESVEVINKPMGKYLGYDALIHFHTKPDYEGYEGSINHNNGFAFNRYNDEKLIFQNIGVR